MLTTSILLNAKTKIAKQHHFSENLRLRDNPAYVHVCMYVYIHAEDSRKLNQYTHTD